MKNGLMPTAEEVQRWVLSVTVHALHIEYFLQELQVGRDDPQRPHDLIGIGNKFEWEVMKGFALQWRDDGSDKFFRQYIAPALKRHRVQYHHQPTNFIVTCKFSGG